jgi:lysylphosphatidylglycerol synthetase-like protein (DUF2156 family)
VTPIPRLAGLTAAGTGLLGGAGMVIGVAALPHPWTTGFVSQAGAPGAGHAGFYRTGVLLLAVTLILLGVALGGLPQVVLTVAGLLATVSGRVSCTGDCPLPPYEHPTPQDLVHAGTSIAAIGLTALAMLIVAVRSRDRLARVSTAVCVPLLCALAVALLAVGRGFATAVLERISLTLILGWVVASALRCGIDA